VAGGRLFDLLLEVRFLLGGQDHELYACLIPVAFQFAPDEHAVLLAADLLPETDQAGLDPRVCLNSHADHTDIHDPDNMFCSHGLVEGDDVQGIGAK